MFASLRVLERENWEDADMGKRTMKAKRIFTLNWHQMIGPGKV